MLSSPRRQRLEPLGAADPAYSDEGQAVRARAEVAQRDTAGIEGVQLGRQAQPRMIDGVLFVVKDEGQRILEHR